jgi:hypothetical protein
LFQISSQKIHNLGLRLDSDSRRVRHFGEEAGAHVTDICAYIEKGVPRASKLEQHLDSAAIELASEIKVPPNQLIGHDR